MAMVKARSAENRITLDTDWSGYLKILDVVGDRHIRVTYDRGALELMTVSNEHELTKTVLGSLLVFYMVETNTGYLPGGSVTFQRRDLDRGLEPDECWWIANHEMVLGIDDLDLSVHPPPDLVLEVEVSRSALNRLGILAAMGIPEVWRCRRGQIRILTLSPERTYLPAVASRVLPGLPMALVLEHLNLRKKKNTTEILRSFRDCLKTGQRSS